MDDKLLIRFTRFAREAEEKYGVICQLAEVRGERWSFVAGGNISAIPAAQSEKIRLSDHTGVIVYNWEKLTENEKPEFRSRIVELYDAGSEPGALSRAEIIYYLKTEDRGELERLFSRADVVREKYVGNEVHLRGLIEFSNYCTRDCLYCGLRRSNTARHRYRMTTEEIFDAARSAAGLGYRTVVLQSGEDRGYLIDDICRLVERIKRELDVAVTLSMGELSPDDYKRLKDAGADRYLMRFETSDPELFRKLKPDSDQKKRMELLRSLGEAGFQVGSGIMIGLPGQTPESIADDLFLFNELGLDMIGSGPFIPNPETPLAHSKGGDLAGTLKLTALTRLVVPRAHIPATTALGTIDPEGRQKALKCGANVIMPNVTPKKYRKDYLLYPGKICVEDRPEDCRSCIESMLEALGRKIAIGYGHGPRTRFK